MADQLESLGLTTAEGIERLAELQVAEACFDDELQWLDDLTSLFGSCLLQCGEEGDGFVCGEAEHLVNVQAGECVPQGRGLVALTFALGAGDEEVAEELHLDLLEAIAHATLAAAIATVEAEEAWGEACGFRLWSLGKKGADGIEGTDKDCGCGAWSASQR
jgi:hypothetical protein